MMPVLRQQFSYLRSTMMPVLRQQFSYLRPTMHILYQMKTNAYHDFHFWEKLSILDFSLLGHTQSYWAPCLKTKKQNMWPCCFWKQKWALQDSAVSSNSCGNVYFICLSGQSYHSTVHGQQAEDSDIMWGGFLLGSIVLRVIRTSWEGGGGRGWILVTFSGGRWRHTWTSPGSWNPYVTHHNSYCRVLQHSHSLKKILKNYKLLVEKSHDTWVVAGCWCLSNIL